MVKGIYFEKIKTVTDKWWGDSLYYLWFQGSYPKSVSDVYWVCQNWKCHIRRCHLAKKKTHAKYAKTKKIKSIPILGTHMELGELWKILSAMKKEIRTNVLLKNCTL